MLVSGAIKVLPIGVREYSTAMDLDLVTRLATNPAVSRLRSVLVRTRCETPLSSRNSSPWRYGSCRRQDRISTVHLPMKIVEASLELEPDSSCILFHPTITFSGPDTAFGAIAPHRFLPLWLRL